MKNLKHTTRRHQLRHPAENCESSEETFLFFKFRMLALLVTVNMYVRRLLTDLLMKIKVVWHVIPCRR
jgi:hypothetical protein